MAPSTKTFDPFDPAFLRDPYPAYSVLRDSDPVHFHPADPDHDRPEFWALSRYADIVAAVREPESFSSAHGLTFYADEIAALGLAPTLVMMDPPEHSLKRRLVASGFSPRRVAQTEDTIRSFARERLAELAERARSGEAVDIHALYSATIPTFVLGFLLGIPAADRPLLDPWVSALTTIQDNGFAFGGLGTSAVSAVAEMFEYFGELIASRREDIDAGREVPDDLITGLLRAEYDGEQLSDWDVLGFCFVIVAGGNDTTGNLISHTIAQLTEHPEQRAEVAANPGLIPGALMECLRRESSVQALARTTTRELSISGVRIPEGSKVMMYYGSGNRDEREFGPDAAELNIHREFTSHLAFSQGPHFCIGSHFAKLQARVALEELYAAFPAISADVGGARRIESPFTRGFRNLPVYDFAATASSTAAG